MLNRVVLIGRLTKDPELRYTSNGTAVATFTLAVDRNYSNQQGERQADFLNIVVWRQLAELCANYLKKGRLTAVEGSIQSRSYDNQEGRKVYVTEIVADNVRFLESNRDRGEMGAGAGTGADYGAAQRDFRGQPQRNNNQDPFAGETIDISDDDLPF